MRRAWIAIGLLIPLSVYALEYRDLSKLYLDAPFPAGDAAGISFLTSLGAVQGDPDGNFHPRRTLNRAEFLKIALLSSPKLRVSTTDAENCFPDVKKSEWFSAYVCLAKKRGMVSGYPDGTFKPGQQVNYAEALKILGQLYQYVAYSAPDEPWYMGYVRAAEFNKTALPIALAYDRPLTRGQMARLASAFRAQADGELATYRLAEKDLNAVIAMQRQSSSSSTSSRTSISSISSVSSVSSASSSATSTIFPATKHMILLGSDAVIADGFLSGETAPFTIRNVTVVFKSEPKNLSVLSLITDDGQSIATLRRDVFDNDNRTWKAEGDAITRKIFPSAGARIGLRLLLKDRSTGGFATEVIQVKTLSLTVGPASSDTDSHQEIPTDVHFPPQQSIQAQITSIQSALPPLQPVASGTNLTVASFAFRGTVIPGAELFPTQITFTISGQNNVSFDSWRASVGGGSSVSCAVDTSTTIICAGLPPPDDPSSAFFTVNLKANVRLTGGTAAHAYRIDLVDPGTWGALSGETRPGAVIWSDGSGTYQWLPMNNPLARGSEWK